MDNTCNTDNRPERRTAIVARELKRLNIDIAALSETRLANEGQLKEHGGGYTFFWKGKDLNEPRIHGVGFAIKNGIVDHLDELPCGINERLMTLRLKLTNNQRATVISAYAPTLTSEDDQKEEFYSQLDEILKNIPRSDKILLLGDFNARVGRDSALWGGVIGKDGVGKCNSNGTLLLTKCSEHNLVITNTLFRQKNKFKTSWQHPRSKHWHLIDYVIVRARDKQDVLITKAMTSSDDCWTDHRLIRSIMALHVHQKYRKQRKNIRCRVNTERLKDENIKLKLHQALDEKLPENYPENVEEHWQTFKSAVLSAGEESAGFVKKKHEDWFDENDEEIQSLIEKKRKAFNVWQNNPKSTSKKQLYQNAKAEVQRKTRHMKNQWWISKSREMQHLVDTNNTHAFFNATRTIYGPSHHGINALKSKDSTEFLKDTNSINSRWKQHFEELLNRDTQVDVNIFNTIPQGLVQNHLDETPSLLEVEIAISQLKNYKAPGMDGIPAELFKEGNTLLVHHLHRLMDKIWKTGTIPDDLRDALIVSIFKKGDRAQCDNYRGISLLSTAGKILARILSNRLKPLAEATLPETQCGFRPNRGTTDMIFCARQMQEKSREQGQPLYMAFIDLVKAFDSVNREALWSVLSRIGCPPKFIQILRLLHDGMSGKVLNSNGPGESFKITTGVKQGCVIAPTLFSIYVGAILHLVKEKIPKGVEIIYRTDGGLFNLSRLRAKSKVSATTVLELQYADDNVILANSEHDLQHTLDAFSEAYKSIGLEINSNKTQILWQPAPTCNAIPPGVMVNGSSLKNVEHFPYLGSHLSTNANIDVEIQYRLHCASAAFGRMRVRVFDNHDISTQTKLYVYQAVVVPTLLYGCETWTTYRRHLLCLEKYHHRCIRRILGIKWQDRRTNVSVLEEANATSIESLIIKHQLRWTGHVSRMPESRLPKQIMYCQLKFGQRKQGGQQKRYKDVLKSNLKKSQIDPGNWESVASTRSDWRRLVHQGHLSFELERRRLLSDKRKARKERMHSRRNNPQGQVAARDTKCHHCGRVCGSKIGLYSHQKIHVN